MPCRLFATKTERSPDVSARIHQTVEKDSSAETHLRWVPGHRAAQTLACPQPSSAWIWFTCC